MASRKRPAFSRTVQPIMNHGVDPGNMVTPLDPIGAHSQYWDIGSASLNNLARITDGQYSQIQWAVPPQLPQPGQPGSGMPGVPYP